MPTRPKTAPAGPVVAESILLGVNVREAKPLGNAFKLAGLIGIGKLIAMERIGTAMYLNVTFDNIKKIFWN